MTAADPTPTQKALEAARAIMDQAHFSDGSLCGKPYPVLRNNAEIKAVALALDRFAAARVEAERADWQAKIHALCPDAENNWCRNGMLYGSDDKPLGACGWSGHIVGGYT